MSDAKQKFEYTLGRSLILFEMSKDFYNIKELEDKQKEAMADIGRGGIVLAIASMDAYFTEKFAELFVPFLKKKGASKSLVEILEKAGLDVKQALELLGMERPYRRIRSLIEKHLARHTTQNFNAIDKLFKNFGIKDFSESVQRKTRRRTLKRSIEILIKRRHAIVHEGDSNRRGRLTEFDWNIMKKRLRDLLLFVDTADELIEDLKRKLN